MKQRFWVKSKIYKNIKSKVYLFKCLIFKENVFGINWIYILSDQITLKVTFYFVLVLQNYMEFKLQQCFLMYQSTVDKQTCCNVSLQLIVSVSQRVKEIWMTKDE